MGVFSKKQNTEEAKPVVAETTQSVIPASGKDAAYTVISNPRITEKAATLAAAQNVYIFDISPRSNKIDVLRAVKALYNVEPLKVNIVSVPRKQVFTKRVKGFKGGGKKAYVYLKKGDTIELA